MVKQDPIYTKLAKNWLNSLSFSSQQEVSFLDLIFKQNKVRKVLDVACGAGRLTFPLYKLGYGVTGTDLSPQFIKSDIEKANCWATKLIFQLKTVTE